jgi:rhamnulose-1-phosphate aldolase/alcohol dehydrogenase
MSATTRLIAPVPDRWPPEGPAVDGQLEGLVFASHLLGSDRAVANYGGGNTSAKGVATDHAGRRVTTMWVKGSGSDLATIGADGFTALRLDEVLPLVERDAMSDEDMVAHLARCQLDPSAPRCSIETLLHAFVPAPHVHHTHPDAINALASTRAGDRLVGACFGDAAAWIPYIRPGFALSKRVGEAVRADPGLRLVVLAKHGLVVWGDSAEEAHRRTIALVNRAAEFVNARTRGPARFGGPRGAAAPLDDEARAELLGDLLPTVRGAVGSQAPKVLTADTSARTVQFVSSAQAERLVTVGAPCPDHLVHTKRLPLWIPYDPGADDRDALCTRIAERAETFRADYRTYFEAHADGETMADPDPRIVLIQHVGLVGVGATPRKAALARDLYQRAIEVMAGAEALGAFVSLTAAESFAVEYWPLELYKLSLAPPPGELESHVAMVTGGAGGIGRAIVEALGAAGASVAVFDIDGRGAQAAVDGLGGRGLAVCGDVTSEEEVAAAYRAAIDAFGGVDIVVSNAGIASGAPLEETTLEEWNRNFAILVTGYFLVAREAFRVLKAQGRGGSLVFVASKNGLAAGRNAAAYSSAKAAELHLARCLAEEGGEAGIRVNTVNPDAVLQGSRIWDSSWREERAAGYGIEPDELEEHYRRRTALGVNIFPSDIAQAVLHFASGARSGKSTGNIVNVDGGVPTAYPR